MEENNDKLKVDITSELEFVKSTLKLTGYGLIDEIKIDKDALTIKFIVNTESFQKSAPLLILALIDMMSYAAFRTKKFHLKTIYVEFRLGEDLHMIESPTGMLVQLYTKIRKNWRTKKSPARIIKGDEDSLRCYISDSNITQFVDKSYYVRKRISSEKGSSG